MDKNIYLVRRLFRKFNYKRFPSFYYYCKWDLDLKFDFMDKEKIMSYYFMGFTDELEGRSRKVPEGVANISYNLGRSHALIGDDVRIVDYLTEEEIVEMVIKGK